MLFSSTVFIYLFLPCVLFGYYVLFRRKRNLQNIFLLLASLFFYAWGEPKFVLIMIGSINGNWFLGLLVDKAKTLDKLKFAKALIAVTCIFNLGILFIFKYFTFVGNTITNLLGISVSIPQIALPIGISFFTFQAMSYVIDVYRGKGVVQKNILNLGLYISFFPQLIAGPIVRYETIAEEINNRKETIDDFFDGFARFIVGLAKKVLLANNFALLADSVFNSCSSGDSLSVALSWLGAIAYTLQIFFDFSGYSDMAIGLGRMFGFHFLENFNFPYISKSISEFWRRWHISLGTWFRDYLYFPLGGSRVSKPRLIFNLFIVWTLTGVWHGANWTFLLWGFMYFVLISIEKLTGIDKKSGKVLNIFKWLYTILFVIIGWVIFRADSLSNAWMYIRMMFGMSGNAGIDAVFTSYFEQNIILLIIGILLCIPFFRWVRKKIPNNIATDILHIVFLVGLFILSVCCLVSNSYNPFIYFNF